jgi:hypothetical protein
MLCSKLLTIFLNIVGRAVLVAHTLLMLNKIQSIKANGSRSDWHIYLTLVFPVFILIDMLRSVYCVPRLESKWYSRSVMLFILSELPLMWMLEFEKNELVVALKNRTNSILSSSNTTAQIEHEVQNQNSVDEYHTEIESIELWSQSFYMFIVIARLLIPKRHCSLEQMSNLGLLLLGTASDLQEFQAQMGDLFEANHDKYWIHCVFMLVILIWTWSISLMAINLDRCDSKPSPRFIDSLVQNFYWKITINLFLNDIPYLLVRLLIIYFIENAIQESFFFMAKNVIGIALGVSRIWSSPSKKLD